MALTQYLGAGQTLSQAVSARYAAIGEEQKRDVLTELFAVRNQQRGELFSALRSLLQLGDTLASNYEENLEINRAMEEEKKTDPSLEKTSGLGRDIFATPTYRRRVRTEFPDEHPDWHTEPIVVEGEGNPIYEDIRGDTLYNMMMRNKYRQVNPRIGGY